MEKYNLAKETEDLKNQGEILELKITPKIKNSIDELKAEWTQ